MVYGATQNPRNPCAKSLQINTSNTSLRLLFYVEQDYSFAILRPLQAAARQRGHDVRWLLLQDASAELLEDTDQTLDDAAAVVAWRPDAVFAPGDRVPGFFPGLKVQVFHGINEDKRGNQYAERGLFDLYCTQGPGMTAMLESLAAERGYFKVVETGWLKLDSILNQPQSEKFERPQILLASTFSPALSGADALYDEVARLAQSDRWQWLVTLHPKMAQATKDRYAALAGPNLEFFGTADVPALLQRADVMVSDNSSILQEFLILAKPVVTYRNRDPQGCMIDIRDAADLEQAIEFALRDDDPARAAAIEAYGPALTPHLDGRSADRVLDAVAAMLASAWQNRKPANIWRNLKMRRQLNYYTFG